MKSTITQSERRPSVSTRDSRLPARFAGFAAATALGLALAATPVTYSAPLSGGIENTAYAQGASGGGQGGGSANRDRGRSDGGGPGASSNRGRGGGDGPGASSDRGRGGGDGPGASSDRGRGGGDGPGASSNRGRGGGPGGSSSGAPGRSGDAGPGSQGRGGPPSWAGGPDRDPGETVGVGQGRPDWAGPDDARVRGQERYNAVIPGGSSAQGEQAGGPPGFGQGVGNRAVRLDDTTTQELIESGWVPPGQRDTGDFANHGERVSTFVQIARELGYDPHVGALQANFGTPEEVAPDLSAELRDLRDQLEGADDPETIAELEDEIAEREAELRDLVEAARPGLGPMSDWSILSLDVTGDGVVNQDDLAALLEGIDDDEGDAITDPDDSTNGDDDADGGDGESGENDENSGTGDNGNDDTAENGGDGGNGEDDDGEDDELIEEDLAESDTDNETESDAENET